jgi:hypothetical protein
MTRGGNRIYIGFKGKMTKIGSPKGRVENANFIITWRDMHWSGYRTLAECEDQFHELEERGDEVEDFAVIEDI